MSTWQWVLLALVLVVPAVLLVVQHPAGERLSVRGVPLSRRWRGGPAPAAVPDDQAH